MDADSPPQGVKIARRNTAKCIAVSQTLTSTAERLSLLDMAQAWIDLAIQAEKNEKLAALVYETPDRG